MTIHSTRTNKVRKYNQNIVFLSFFLFVFQASNQRMRGLEEGRAEAGYNINSTQFQWRRLEEGKQREDNDKSYMNPKNKSSKTKISK